MSDVIMAPAADTPARRPKFVMKRLTAFDPDKALDHISRLVETRIVNIDAKVFEGSIREHGWTRRTHYRNAQEFFKSPGVRRRIREAVSASALKDVKDFLSDASLKQVKRVRENFSLGEYSDEQRSGTRWSIGETALPSMNAPQSRQMLLIDTLDMHRKCWEAATRNPLGKRICRIIPMFSLGRGVKGYHQDPEYLKAWNAFWKLNGMGLRTKQMLYELVMFGEIFLRYFPTKSGLVVRSIDPSTIWEIVTDPEDIENVYYYHQQFVTINQMMLATNHAVKAPPPATLVIRQIPASEIDHTKINVTGSEKRGRSELYAILSWLVRFREFTNDRIVLNKMRSMFALDVSVKGDDADLTAAEDQFATPPGSGAVLIHSDGVSVDFKNANTNANEAKTDAEMFLKIIAVGSGISEQFLGVSYGSSRAGALIQTEPDVKNFETYREIMEDVLLRASRRVFQHAKLEEPDIDMEFTFPGIAAADRTAKLKDIALAESMDYFSKARAAQMAAREFEITNYQFDQEQQIIREERGENPVIAQGMQQVVKTAPDPMEMAAMQASAAGKPGPVPKAAGGDKNPVAYTGAEAGMAGDTGGRDLPKTKATLSRQSFSRDSEKAAVAGSKSSGTPKLSEQQHYSSRRGWTDTARVKSLLTRRKRKAERLLRLAESMKEAHGEATPEDPTPESE